MSFRRFSFVISSLLLSNFLLLNAALQDIVKYAQHREVQASSLDELVVKGVRLIESSGSKIIARAGNAEQSYHVSYILLDPRNRLHRLRNPFSIQYFCRELLAYFNNSLKADEGLNQASKFWSTLADENGCIQSNYGYYIFHEKIPHEENKTQYEWVIDCFSESKDTRRALININQPIHKKAGHKDFPCTIGLQFFIQHSDEDENDYFCCSVASRSTDIYTGLPYDMGFFSFVTELIYQDLCERFPSWNLKLGYVAMNSTFTQIYNKTKDNVARYLNNKCLEFLTKKRNNNLTAEDLNVIKYDDCLSRILDNANLEMPPIENAKETLRDIYEKTAHTPVMEWIVKHSNLKESC